MRSPEAAVAALYDVISGPADETRDWERFASLFLPDGRIRAFTTLPDGTPQEGSWSVEQFAGAAAEYYAEDGFWEREIWSRTDRFGTVAHVLSSYESRVGSPDADPIGRGLNSIQLVRHEGRWWIAAIAFDVERPDDPLPPRYLSGDGGSGTDG